MPQDWGNLLFKLSLVEALEEVATRVAEEAWLYNENAFNFCFYYIHRINFCSYNKIFRKPTFNSLYDPFGSPVSEGQKPQEREDATALRCSEPLRYKVGGPKRSTPNCAGWDRLGMNYYRKATSQLQRRHYSLSISHSLLFHFPTSLITAPKS